MWCTPLLSQRRSPGPKRLPQWTISMGLALQAVAKLGAIASLSTKNIVKEAARLGWTAGLIRLPCALGLRGTLQGPVMCSHWHAKIDIQEAESNRWSSNLDPIWRLISNSPDPLPVCTTGHARKSEATYVPTIDRCRISFGILVLSARL